MSNADYVTVEEASVILNVCPETVRRYVRDGRIEPAYRTTKGKGTIYISYDELNAFQQKHEKWHGFRKEESCRGKKAISVLETFSEKQQGRVLELFAVTINILERANDEQKTFLKCNLFDLFDDEFRAKFIKSYNSNPDVENIIEEGD